MTVDVKTMEGKKNQPLIKPAGANAKEVETKSIRWRSVLEDIKSEFKKISWTTAEELRTYTKIVVGATFFLGMGIYIMDLVIQAVLSVLAFAVRLMIGG